MVNDSFLCNHYHFMKMSNSDRFKECFWHKRPKNHDFTPGFGAKMQFTQPKCTPNTHETISFYWLIIVLHAITIPSWKWMIYMILKGAFCKNTPENQDFTPGFGAKMQFNLPKCTPHSCKGIILLMNDSFACYHYPLMKMSDLYNFKGRILQKHPQKSRFYPRIWCKNAI